MASDMSELPSSILSAWKNSLMMFMHFSTPSLSTMRSLVALTIAYLPATSNLPDLSSALVRLSALRHESIAKRCVCHSFLSGQKNLAMTCLVGLLQGLASAFSVPSPFRNELVCSTECTYTPCVPSGSCLD